MKGFTLGKITCNCSKRMKTVGKHIRIYELTCKKQPCPNCGKKRYVKRVA